ncbi:MAG TPA: TauD/TfdA family dioxygenase [Allosphingosinicella sp.]|uniref:TauD/TfdA family dioxygenase n=1 Tax=Allosphingosinicella sp. TaxID=2823234 RepID=UPI002F2A9870
MREGLHISLRELSTVDRVGPVMLTCDLDALPLTLEPDRRGTIADLVERIAEERAELSRKLLGPGALLLRGWRMENLADFMSVVRAFAGERPLFGYAGGASPRSALGDGSYSSTDYPPHVALSLHNELSYTAVHPRLLFFACLQAPEAGGETTLGDSRRILHAIEPQAAARFKQRHVRYLRNLSPFGGAGYSWQEAFETEDPVEAEARARAMGASVEWQAGGWLRLSQVRPATATHPETGEEVWFNQADGFHPSALDPVSYAQALAFAGSEESFRLGVTYGDGGEIAAGDLEEVRAAVRNETRPHRWREGDVLVIDNLLVAHGRRPFSGPRKIVLAMV